MEQEIWKDIPNYEGLYQCSNLGRVKSIGNNYLKKTKILKNVPDSKGYGMNLLVKNGIKKRYKTHQLVAITFLNFIPQSHKYVIDHINGNVIDNNVLNLQIVTSRENTTVCFSKSRHKYTSKYPGVFFDKSRNKFCSRINLNNKCIYLGRYLSEIDAANAYQKKLKESLY